MLSARQNHTMHSVVRLPHNDVHHGLRIIFSRRQGIVESTEQPFANVLAVTTNDKGSSRIICYLPDAIVLIVLDDFRQITAQPLPSLLQRQMACTDCLQMGMIRGRGATMWTII